MMNYKCMVPQCISTSIKTPNKLFISVPSEKEMLHKWLKLARIDSDIFFPTHRDPEGSIKSSMYFCEDHFDLPNDMDNYMEYHLTGSVSTIRMKPGFMPSKFYFQPDQKMSIQECEKELEESNIIAQHSEQQNIPTASGSADMDIEHFLPYHCINLQEETVMSSDPEHSYWIPDEISQEKKSPEIQPTSANKTLNSTMKRPSILKTYSGPRKKIVRRKKSETWEDEEKTFFTYFAKLDHDYARGPVSGYEINSRIKIAKRRISKLWNIMQYNNSTVSLLEECYGEMYKCHYCTSEYLHRHDLLNHVEKQHLDIQQELILNKKVNEDTDSAESFETYKCDYCDIEYIYETDLLSHVEQHLAINQEDEEGQETLDIKPEIYQCNKCPASFINEEGMTNHLQIMHGDVIEKYIQTINSQNNRKKSKDKYSFTYSVYAEKEYENTNNGEQQNSESLDSFLGYNFAELQMETEIKKEFCGPLEDVDLPLEDQNFDDNLGSNLYGRDDFSGSHSDININIIHGTTVGPADDYSPNVDQNNINMIPELHAFTKHQDFDLSRVNNPDVIKCKCCKIPFSDQKELLDHMHELINTKSKFLTNVKFKKPEIVCDDTSSSFMTKPNSLDTTHTVFEKPEEERKSPSVIGHSSNTKPKKSIRKCIRCSGRIRKVKKGGKKRFCFKCQKSKLLTNVKQVMQADSVQFNKPESVCDDDTNSSFMDTAKSLDNTQLVYDKPEKERDNPTITEYSSTSKPIQSKPKCIHCSRSLKNVAKGKKRICFKCRENKKYWFFKQKKQKITDVRTCFSNQEEPLDHTHELKSTKAKLCKNVKPVMQADSVQFNNPESVCDDDTNSLFMDNAKSLDNTQLVYDKPEEERDNPSITKHSSKTKPKIYKRKCKLCSGMIRCFLARGRRQKRICFICREKRKARFYIQKKEKITDVKTSFSTQEELLNHTHENNHSITGHSSTSKPKCIRCSRTLRNVAGDKKRFCFFCQKSGKGVRPRCIFCLRWIRNVAGGKRRICIICQTKLYTNVKPVIKADRVQFNEPDNVFDDDNNSSFMDTAKSLDNTQLVYDKPEEERDNNPSITGHSSTLKPKHFKPKCIRCSRSLRTVAGDKRRICCICQKSGKGERPRCILCLRWIRNLAGGKRRICFICQIKLCTNVKPVIQAERVQFHEPGSVSDDDTNSSFMDTAKSLDNTQLGYDKPEEERDNPSLTGHSSNTKPKKFKRKCIRCSGRIRKVKKGGKKRICFKCQKSKLLTNVKPVMQADSVQFNNPENVSDDDTNSSLMDTDKSLDDTQLVYDKPEEERDNPSLTGHLSNIKPKKYKRKCIRCSGRIRKVKKGGKKRICFKCQKSKLLTNVKPVMQADNVQFNKPESVCDDDTNSSFMDTVKSLDNTQLVYDKPEEERDNNSTITGHSSTSEPKHSKPKCIRCSRSLRIVAGDKRRICFICQKFGKGERPRCILCSRSLKNVAEGKRRICFICQKSGIGEKPRCILCSRSIENQGAARRRICVICQRSRIRFNCRESMKALIQLEKIMKVRNNTPQNKNMLKNAPVEEFTEEKNYTTKNKNKPGLTDEQMLENMQFFMKTPMKISNARTEERKSIPVDNDLLKPLRIEDEKILVQPRDPTVCKYCLKPLEKTVKSGQNNAFCDKCQSIETSNGVRRKSNEEIRISDMLLCTPDIIAEECTPDFITEECTPDFITEECTPDFITEDPEPNKEIRISDLLLCTPDFIIDVPTHWVPKPNLALTKVDSTQSLRKDKLRINKVDTKCCVRLERIIIHGCRICRSKFINKLDLREHVTKYHS